MNTTYKSVIDFEESDPLLKASEALESQAQDFMRFAAVTFCTERLKELNNFQLVKLLKNGTLSKGKIDEVKKIFDQTKRVKEAKEQLEAIKKPIDEKWLNQKLGACREPNLEEYNLDGEVQKQMRLAEKASLEEMRRIRKSFTKTNASDKSLAKLLRNLDEDLTCTERLLELE